MIEGRRQAARRRRRSLATLVLAVMASAVALLLTGAVQDMQAYPAHQAGALALAGWLIAIGGVYIFRPPR